MRVNIQPIGLKSVYRTKNNNIIHYSTNPNSKLKSDVFIKSAQPSFGNNLSYDEKQKLRINFHSALWARNSQALVEQYEKNPETIEMFLDTPRELDYSEKYTIDRTFGFFDDNVQYFGIYSKNYPSRSHDDKQISLLNINLFNSDKETLVPLLKTIALKNPKFFSKDNILAMYANDKCEEAISILANSDSNKVFEALESDLSSYNNGKRKNQLAIENLKITPSRQRVFETLFVIDPLRTSNIISALPTERRKEFKFDESTIDSDVRAVLDVLNSKDDTLEVNQKLLDLYDKSPESMIKALLSLDIKTGELYVNSMMKDTKRNYYGIMLYLLLKDSNKFFELAQKTDCMWNAANNKKQPYLELFEQALFVNPTKTKEMLDKTTSNKLAYPRSTPAIECIDNQAFDYTELFKAFYQEDINQAFQLFASRVDRQTNLLTYYVEQKGYGAEDFISYLTNQNLRFVKSLLSAETLAEIKDLRYKTAMKNLNKAKTELEKEFGRKLTETEKRVMERISGVEEEMRKEVKRLDGKIDDISGYTYRLNEKVMNHLYPPSTVRDDGFIPSGAFESVFHSYEEIVDPLLSWHFPPVKPYDDGVI